MKKLKCYSISVLSMLILMTNSIAINQTVFQTNSIVEFRYRQVAKEKVRKMTLEEKIGQMFIVDFSNYTNYPPVGGVILFQNNLRSINQITELIDNIQKNSTIPLFIGVDQEGGAVNRLDVGTTMIGNMALGATFNNQFVYEAGKLIGSELNVLGINTNFAPVLDVNNNPLNPVIGIRSFGSEPNLVGSLGIEYINGLRKSRVIPVAKHFPGHGDTRIDSHFDLPLIPHDFKRLKEIEHAPFQRAIDKGVEMIMTAHITFPAIDNTTVKSKKDGQRITVPATLSNKVLNGLLRSEMGYEGIIITDAFNMKAISDHFNEEQAVVMAIEAGVDIILMPINFERAFNRILTEVKLGNISEERIDESVIRIMKLKSKYGVISSNKREFDIFEDRLERANNIIGSQLHIGIQEKIAYRSTTILINEENRLPFRLKEEDNIFLIMPNNRSRDTAKSTILEVVDNSKSLKIDSLLYSSNSRFNAEVQRKINNADYVIVGTTNLNHRDSRAKYINSVISYTNDKNIPTVVISMANPYDIMYLTNTRAYIATYGDFHANIYSGIKTLLGINTPRGRLPVEIPNKEGTGILFEFGHGLEYNE